MIENKTISIHDLEFDCRISGNENHELVLFLHGFPETSYMWIPLMDSISKLGFYCVAPNMRGYSKSACPKGKKHYTIDKLTDDAINIASTFSKESFHLVAHDWGAAIGWNLVYQNPKRIISYTALSVPHIKAFSQAIVLDKDQKKKSQYIKNFQIPFLPEINIRKNNFAVFRRLWKHSSNDEIEDYLSVFKSKRCLTASINYYRANYKIFRNNSIGDIKKPTLFIWGEHDLAIGNYGVENNHKYMKDYYKFVQLETGHWLIQTAFKQVNNEIVEHLLKFKVTSNLSNNH
ncbi:hypothetical protein A9Q87_04790 [Flavobacteriales bacterium 34_180_T64]|nr:hypothetical protein A9Q87_04790 [Flavobacteriales bacterium 34_180_T64]